MKHGSHLDPPNRFEKTHLEADWEHMEWDAEFLQERQHRSITYLPDESATIVSENDSPDVHFRYSINPYRGCVHACSYCYARNTHEYLGYNAGLDFETKILVKHKAPELFREFLSRPSWKPEHIALSGVTDCYQPAERRYLLTHGCLEIADAFSQPMSIVTKNALVVRDLDLLRRMAERRLIQVNISVTTLDPDLARVMEPRTSIPAARLRAIEMLRAAGVPVRVLVAPIIPGLNDSEAPAILKAAKERGAQDASYVLLRLPLTVEPVFRDWLHRTHPDRAAKVESLVKQTREGKFNKSDFRERMRGSGPVADQIRQMFKVMRVKLGYSELPALDCTQFAAPLPSKGQLRLF